MKKLFNASFEQSLNIKDDSLVQYMIQDTEKRGIYNGKKRWVLLIIAIVFIFVQYGFVIVTEVGIQNPDQDSFVEQANINMLPRSVFCLLFLIYLFIWLYTKKYNNDSIKIFITMNTVNNYLIWLLIEANLFFITFFLKPLTVVGTTLLFGSIGLIGYAVFRSKKRSLENVLYETEGKKDKLDEWLEKVIKVVMRYGWIVVIVVMGWKILFPSEGVRTDIVGFIGIVGMWTAINIGFIVAEVYLFFPYLLYGYYKYKYPEEYREWEGKSQIEWYGEKYYNKHIKGTEREKKNDQ